MGLLSNLVSSVSDLSLSVHRIIQESVFSGIPISNDSKYSQQQTPSSSSSPFSTYINALFYSQDDRFHQSLTLVLALVVAILFVVRVWTHESHSGSKSKTKASKDSSDDSEVKIPPLFFSPY